MLEVKREEDEGEVSRVHHQETVVLPPPPDQRVRPRIANHLVGLRHERRHLYTLHIFTAATAAARNIALPLHRPPHSQSFATTNN